MGDARTAAVPGWLIFTGTTLVAALFGAGTVALLLLGRAVPDQLWVIDTAIAVAYFGAGPFSLMAQHVSGTNAQLLDTVNHSTDVLHTAIKATSGMTATNTHGEPQEAGVVGG